MRHMKIDQSNGEDIYDLPDSDRESFNDDVHQERDTFQRCGIDDYAPTDNVIRMNGDRYFATRM